MLAALERALEHRHLDKFVVIEFDSTVVAGQVQDFGIGEKGKNNRELFEQRILPFLLLQFERSLTGSQLQLNGG